MHNSSKCSRSKYKVSLYVSTVLLLVTSAVHARTVLSGSIGDMQLTADKGPYIVEKDLVIPEGEKTVIEAGCRFFFKPFSGIIIYGSLNVAGTAEQPVLFTAINDSLSPDKSDQLPNPFDWNGIHVTPKSENVVLAHFTLAYSVYGIKAQSKLITIDNGLFRQNGQFHFTMMDSPMPVADGIPYSYSGTSPARSSRHSTALVEQKKNSGNKVFVKKGVPLIIGGTGIAGGVVAMVYLNKWLNLQDEWRITSDAGGRKQLEDDGKLTSEISAVTGGFSLAAIAAGAVLFWLWNREEKQNTAIIPVILPDRVGTILSVNLPGTMR